MSFVSIKKEDLEDFQDDNKCNFEHDSLNIATMEKYDIDAYYKEKKVVSVRTKEDLNNLQDGDECDLEEKCLTAVSK